MTDAVQDLLARRSDVLAFERSWWSHAGGKDEAIRDRFGVGAGDYYLALATILDDPEALAEDPLLVRRLRRQRVVRRHQRSARRAGDA
jgi:hypothetical protein